MKLTIDSPQIAGICDKSVMGLDKADLEKCLASGDGTIKKFVTTGENHFVDCFCTMFDETDVQLLKDSKWQVLIIETSSDTSLSELADELHAFEHWCDNEKILIGLKCSNKPQSTTLHLITIY